MAQWVEHLQYKKGDLSLDPQHLPRWLWQPSRNASICGSKDKMSLWQFS